VLAAPTNADARRRRAVQPPGASRPTRHRATGSLPVPGFRRKDWGKYAACQSTNTNQHAPARERDLGEEPWEEVGDEEGDIPHVAAAELRRRHQQR
jgi:hypothetical protein